MDLFGTLHSLERLLDYRVARHGVLASNLANAETPRYEAKDLIFNDAMNAATALMTTDTKHVAPDDLGVAGAELTETGGAVNLEGEMAKVAVNRVLYESAIEITRKRLGLLRYAATDGQT